MKVSSCCLKGYLLQNRAQHVKITFLEGICHATKHLHVGPPVFDHQVVLENALNTGLLELILLPHNYVPRENLHQHHVLEGCFRTGILQTGQRIEGLEEEGEGGLEVVLIALLCTKMSEGT